MLIRSCNELGKKRSQLQQHLTDVSDAEYGDKIDARC